jgi:hypothetical protein
MKRKLSTTTLGGVLELASVRGAAALSTSLRINVSKLCCTAASALLSRIG